MLLTIYVMFVVTDGMPMELDNNIQPDGEDEAEPLRSMSTSDISESDTESDISDSEQPELSDDPGSGADLDAGESTDFSDNDGNPDSDSGDEFDDASDVDTSSDDVWEGDVGSDDDQQGPRGPGQAARASAAAKARAKAHRARERGDQRLYPEAVMAVIDLVYAMVDIKEACNMKIKPFNSIMRLFSLALPPGNVCPTSFYCCKSILEVKDANDFLWDSCPCGKWSWDPVDPKSEEDHCPACKCRRFKPRVGNAKLVPVQVGILRVQSEVYLGHSFFGVISVLFLPNHS